MEPSNSSEANFKNPKIHFYTTWNLNLYLLFSQLQFFFPFILLYFSLAGKNRNNHPNKCKVGGSAGLFLGLEGASLPSRGSMFLLWPWRHLQLQHIPPFKKKKGRKLGLRKKMLVYLNRIRQQIQMFHLWRCKSRWKRKIKRLKKHTV